MPSIRSIEAIDKELRFFVNKRAVATREISRLSGQVVDDTKKIDRLLAERSQVRDDQLLAQIQNPA